MQNFGKRMENNMDGMDAKSSGTCFMGCLVTCNGLCSCTTKKATSIADGTDGGKNTTVWGRNYVSLSGD